MNSQQLNKNRSLAIFCGLLNCCLTLYTGYTDNFDSWPFRISFGFTIIGIVALFRGMYLHRQMEKGRKRR